MKLAIEFLKNICTLDNIEITLHAAKRLEQRGISLSDVINCIKSGKIIEHYPDDYPFPSCLVLGLSTKTQYLHVVVGSNQELLWIVTAYYPDLEKWEADFETRKENQL